MTMAHRALAAPDVLHLILLELPQQDLLLVQRVCRLWRSLVSTSKVLLAALFLHPDSAVYWPHKTKVRLNPLLVSRFPAFFDHTPSHGTDDPRYHGLGPWYGTHWFESIYPWPEQPEARDRGPLRRAAPQIEVATKQVDPCRHAAYSRQEASWRRMLPCQPPPAELQICYEYRPSREARHGELRRLKFTDTDDESSGQGPHPTLKSRHKEKRGWLTFSTIHDFVAAAWFSGMSTCATNVQFDHTYEDTVRSPTAANWKFMRREHLRSLLPSVRIGGPDHLLVILIHEHRGNGPKRYHDLFASVIAQAEFARWDEVHALPGI